MEVITDQRSISVHVYGKLAEAMTDPVGTVTKAVGKRQKVLRIDLRTGATLSTLLAQLGFGREDLYTVFLNGSLLVTRNGMAPWLRYQQAQDDVWNWDRDVELNPGDRIGLFGEDMALLVV